MLAILVSDFSLLISRLMLQEHSRALPSDVNPVNILKPINWPPDGTSNTVALGTSHLSKLIKNSMLLLIPVIQV